MSKQEIQNIIISCLREYHPAYVGLFGSFVRGDGSAASDIDILVRFNESYSLLQLVRIENETNMLLQYIQEKVNNFSNMEFHTTFKNKLLKYELSGKLGIKVDLVTEGSLKNERVKRSIHQDLKMIYQA